MSVWGVNLPLDLPITSILHVKLGKYELSELKSFILIWGVSGGCQRGVTSDLTLAC